MNLISYINISIRKVITRETAFDRFDSIVNFSNPKTNLISSEQEKFNPKIQSVFVTI